MVVLIPLVGILGDPYKIPIITRNALRRLSRRVLGILGSIMIDQTNTTESESLSNGWFYGSSSTRTSLFLTRTFITLQIGTREIICDDSVYWGPQFSYSVLT